MKLPFPERVIRQHWTILGKTGSGKSSANRLIVEHLLERNKRVAVIDPKGDWWGLKSSANGRAPGYPVICFGDFKEPRATDVPINAQSGKHIAELITSGNRPCIVGMRGWMPAQLATFWLDFAPTLFNTVDGELYVILAEAQNFAPKGKILDPQAGRVIHWTNRILSEGRGLGLIFGIESQRPQKVHNDTLDCCETLIAMRVAHPASREAIKNWMEGNGDPVKAKEILATLAQLKRGEAWVWSPENEFGPARVEFPLFSTFDSFAPPQIQKKVSNAGWSTVDLDAVKTKLASVIAEAKANDPKELKQEIERLKAEKRKLEASNAHVATSTPSKEQVERANAAAVRTATAPLLKQLEIIKRRMAHVHDEIQHATRRLGNAMALLSELPQAVELSAPTPEPPAARPQIPTRPAPAVLALPDGRAKQIEYEDPHDVKLSPGMRKILAAAVQFNGVDLEELTVLTGYKATSRNEYVKRCVAAGLAEKRSDRKVYATLAGAQLLGKDYEALPTGRALYEWWIPRLPEGELKILRHLVDEAHGAEVDKDALGEATRYKPTSRNEYLKRLARRRLVVNGTGTAKAAENLFG